MLEFYGLVDLAICLVQYLVTDLVTDLATNLAPDLAMDLGTDSIGLLYLFHSAFSSIRQ